MTYRHLSPTTAGKVTGRAAIPTSPFPRYAATYVNSPSIFYTVIVELPPFIRLED